MSHFFTCFENNPRETFLRQQQQEVSSLKTQHWNIKRTVAKKCKAEQFIEYKIAQCEFQRNDEGRCVVELAPQRQRSSQTESFLPFHSELSVLSAAIISDEAQHLCLHPKAPTAPSCCLWTHPGTKRKRLCLKPKIETLPFQVALQMMTTKWSLQACVISDVTRWPAPQECKMISAKTPHAVVIYLL